MGSEKGRQSKRLFFHVIYVVLNEMSSRSSKYNNDVMFALSVLKPENADVFLISAKVAPLLHLCGIAVVEEKFAVNHFY